MATPRQRSLPQPELHRPIEVADRSALPQTLSVTASADERANIARRLKIEAVDALSAEINMSPWGTKGIWVSGNLEAEVRQTCVVSLEPVASRVSESISAKFLPAGAFPEYVGEPTDDDEPEPFEGATIDVGELIVQHLALGLDPYPRRPGAELSLENAPAAAAGLVEINAATSGRRAADGPFAGLRRLKKGRGASRE